MIKEDGRIIITCLDVTEKKQIERLKDEFISTVSHELRTPRFRRCFRPPFAFCDADCGFLLFRNCTPAFKPMENSDFGKAMDGTVLADYRA